MIFDDIKTKIEADYETVNENAFKAVKQEIARICDSEGLNFSSLHLTYCWRRGGDESDQIDHDEIMAAFSWYEDWFGVFPDCIYEDGKWFGE